MPRFRWKYLAYALGVAAALGCALFTNLISGPVTYDGAADRVLEEVVHPDRLDQPVIVFGLREPLQPGDEIHPYQKEGFEPFPEPTVIEEETWFFWVDDAPGAMFLHPNRFVFVTAGSGEITVQEAEWWPVLNGEGLWVDEAEYWDEANWVFSNRDAPDPSESGSMRPGLGRRRLASFEAQAGSPGSAIVINGWEPGETLQNEMAESTDQMHDILTDAGFDVTFLGPSQDSNPDRNGEPTTANKVDFFFNKARQMRPSQTLFVYVTGHGGVLSGGDGVIGNVFESLLKDSLDDFDPGVHIIVMLDSCYSGSFNNDMATVADITVTSTDSTSPAYSDLDRWYTKTDVNPDDKGLEFTSGFVEDWNLIQRDPAARARVQARADRSGDNYWEALTAESHITAVEKDFAFAMGWTGPALVRGQPQTRPTATPVQTPTPTPTPRPSSGSVDANVSVKEDNADHGPFIEMPDKMLLEYNISGGVFIVEGKFPWVVVTGEEPDSDGNFNLTGEGTVAGFSGVQVEFTGSFVGTHLEGDYGMGVGGGLPTGQPIIYAIEGEVILPESSPPTPEPSTPVAEAQVFFDVYNAQFLQGDVEGLLTTLHPVAFDLYGEPACTAHVENLILDPPSVEVLDAMDIGTWQWNIEDLTIPVPNTLEVDVNFTRSGETVQVPVHLAPDKSGDLRWFTDCGAPLKN